jgi:transposase-like protein
MIFNIFHRPRFTAEQKQSIRKEYESGLTLNAVARRFKTTRRVVTQAVKDAGDTIRPRFVPGVPS